MAFVFLAIAAGGLGAALLRPLRDVPPFERGLFALLLGLLVWAVWIVAVGSFSLALARSGVVVGAVLSLLWCFFFLARNARLPIPFKGGFDSDWLSKLCVASIVAGLLAALISALAPVTNWDAGAAHLALPAAYARLGHLDVLPGNNYSAYPHLAHALYTVAFGSGSELGVNLLSWTFAALAVGFAVCLGTRLGNRQAGLIGGAALAAAPIFADQAGTPSIDLVFACVVLAAVLALVAWRDTDNVRWLALAAVLAGSACGIRHTGYLTAGLLLIGVVLTTIRGRESGVPLTPALSPRRGSYKATLRASVLFLFVVILAALPWLVRSGVATGNPFFPFFASAFGTAGVVDADVAAIGTHDSMRVRGFGSLIKFPWSVVMAPDAFDGWSANPGALVILLGIPGLIFGGRRAFLIGLFCIAGISAMFFFRQHVRYLLPFFLPLMVLAGVGAVRLPLGRRAAHVVVAACLVLGLAVQAAAVHYKVPVALGLESREAYLASRIERYAAFEWVREHVPDDAVVLSLDPRGYYLDRACYQNFEGLKELVNADSATVLDWMARHRIDYILVPDAYMQSSPGFRETGVQSVVDQWRSDRRHYDLVAALEMDCARGDGTEVVEIYRVQPQDVFARRVRD
jgi:hypothetical protein